jgi:hypothetical protein
MTTVYDGGIWKNITNFYVRNSNSWQEADLVRQKRSGSWQIIYDRGPYESWSLISLDSFGFSSSQPPFVAYSSAVFNSIGMFYGAQSYNYDQQFRFAPESKTPSLEIKYEISVFPTAPVSVQGDLTGTWLSLTTSRVWYLTAPGLFNYGYWSVEGTIYIRRDNLIVSSGALNMSVTQETGS